MDYPLEARLYHGIHCCSNLLQRSCKPGESENDQLQRRGQGRLLSILLRKDGLSMKEIVHTMDIRPSSAGELVEKLALQGYADRRNDGQDKRVYYVYLTASGRQRAAELEQGMLEMYRDAFSGLDDGEKAELEKLIYKLKLKLKDRYGYAHNDGKDEGNQAATCN